jgi:hypothetical protein
MILVIITYLPLDEREVTPVKIRPILCPQKAKQAESVKQELYAVLSD